MKIFQLTKMVFVVGLVSSFFAGSVYADSLQVNITASTQVSNIPPGFKIVQFALMEPWYFGSMPNFAISSAPTEQTLTVNPNFNIPTLELTEDTSTSHDYQLTWFYRCDGLTLNYGSGTNAATIAFTGTIDTGNPGTTVNCTCTGSICSTTATLPAKLVMR